MGSNMGAQTRITNISNLVDNLQILGELAELIKQPEKITAAYELARKEDELTKEETEYAIEAREFIVKYAELKADLARGHEELAARETRYNSLVQERQQELYNEQEKINEKKRELTKQQETLDNITKTQEVASIEIAKEKKRLEEVESANVRFVNINQEKFEKWEEDLKEKGCALTAYEKELRSKAEKLRSIIG